MFTGIIEAQGQVSVLAVRGEDLRLTVETSQLDFSDVALGDSIATNGVCLTVVELHDNAYVADVSKETLDCTTLGQWQVGTAVNLEKAMLPTTRFGGHMVSGHVDGMAEVVDIQEAKEGAKDYFVRSPKALAKYIAVKGSITLDGISLTINSMEADVFRLTIVPHTQQVTAISGWKKGTLINLEVDVVARYLEKLLLSSNAV